MRHRHTISDEQWQRVRDLLPGKAGDPGVTAEDNRLFIDAVLWIAKTAEVRAEIEVKKAEAIATADETARAALNDKIENLEKKGFVKSRKGEATAERGGRAKMYFEITGKGQKALNASINSFYRLIEGMEWKGAMG